MLAAVLLGLSSQKERTPDSYPVQQVEVPCEEQHRKMPKEPVRPGDIADNYLKLENVKDVVITDARGNSESPPYESVHVFDLPGPLVEGVTYDKMGEHALMITTPAPETFTFTFRSLEGAAGSVDLVRGYGNAYPDMAVRYNNLFLPKGATGMLKVTPAGFEPLLVDKDGDGTFETEIKPDGYATGSAANDTDGPTLCFGEAVRGGKTLVTITAVDESGIRAVYYSLDPPPTWDESGPGGAGVALTFRPYTGPFEVDPARIHAVTVFADDKLGNRALDWYKIKGPR